MRNKNIKKVLVIGSSPIITGQVATFDYVGIQACRELKKEGIEVVLINSNPATIMTDKNIADKIYIEPLTIEALKKVIKKEKPDSILPNLGGQIGLNLAMELIESGFLEEYEIKLLGISANGIKNAENRQCFKNMMEKIGEPCIASKVVHNVQDAVNFAKEIGLPVIIRSAYTLGKIGGEIAYTLEELEKIVTTEIRMSKIDEILVEKYISGWKEIEYEVIRDSKGTCITVCNMENIDSANIYTGDSIVVVPSQTLSNKEYQMLRTSAIKIISSLEIEGECNVKFALNPYSFEYMVTEVKPGVSCSYVLASKATGYPIAKVATKIAIGYTLDEIKNDVTGKTYACFEPYLDYVALKIPKCLFKKFLNANCEFDTQIKATGEVMVITSSMEAAFMKGIRSLEEDVDSLILTSLRDLHKDELIERLSIKDNGRIFIIAESLRHGIGIEEICRITCIDKYFIGIIQKIVNMERELKVNSLNPDLLLKAKKYGFTDKLISKLNGKTEEEIFEMRNKNNIVANFKLVDTCSAEFEAKLPYYYSSYDEENESIRTEKPKIMVLGPGPIKLNQEMEFDYCSVHGILALKKAGYEAIIVNNSPEAVSTDFEISDKLYFEPLTKEDVKNIIDVEKPDGVIVQFGGQTAIKLAEYLNKIGVKILGTSSKDINRAENREEFNKVLSKCGILKPTGETAYTCDVEKEFVVDAICDGKDILIPGIVEQLERADMYSGDSAFIATTQTIEKEYIKKIIKYTKKVAKELKIIGMVNIKFIISQGAVYIIEVNPRSSRTVPYISKATNLPVIDIATNVMLGKKLKNMKYGTGLYKQDDYICIKIPVFSFEKIKNNGLYTVIENEDGKENIEVVDMSK